MCKFPRYIVNKHYVKYPLELDSVDVLPPDYYVLVKCGKCSQCRKTKLSNWTFRIMNEIRYSERSDDTYHAEFVTLTIEPKYYDQFKDDPGRAIRLFTERYRQRYGVSLRHFFVTELGDEKGRLHFHGVIFNSVFKISKESFRRVQLKKRGKGKYGRFLSNDGKVTAYNRWLRGLWKYGNTWVDIVRPETAFYIVKYVGKGSDFDPDFSSQMFCSNGLGIQFCEDTEAVRTILCQDSPLFNYDGKVLSVPSYYIRKIFGQDRIRRKMLSNFLDPPLPSRYFDGVPVRDINDWRNKLSFYCKETVPFRKPRYMASLPPSYLLHSYDSDYQNAIDHVLTNVHFVNSLNYV